MDRSLKSAIECLMSGNCWKINFIFAGGEQWNVIRSGRTYHLRTPLFAYSDLLKEVELNRMSSLIIRKAMEARKRKNKLEQNMEIEMERGHIKSDIYGRHEHLR